MIISNWASKRVTISVASWLGLLGFWGFMVIESYRETGPAPPIMDRCYPLFSFKELLSVVDEFTSLFFGCSLAGISLIILGLVSWKLRARAAYRMTAGGIIIATFWVPIIVAALGAKRLHDVSAQMGPMVTCEMFPVAYTGLMYGIGLVALVLAFEPLFGFWKERLPLQQILLFVGRFGMAFLYAGAPTLVKLLKTAMAGSDG